MQFNKAQWKVLKELNIVDPTIGLTSQEVLQRRRGRGGDSNSFEIDNDYNNDNTVSPPINCPNWICCLLPCINYIESMKVYKSIVPEDTIVLRNNNWIQYDASSLVIGDTIQLQTNTIVPADCIILYIQTNNSQQNTQNQNTQLSAELIVDMKYITGYDRPISINVTNNNNNNNNENDSNDNMKLQRLFWGSTIVELTNNSNTSNTSNTSNNNINNNNISIIALVTGIGKDTYVSKLIQTKQFPPKTISLSSNLSSSIELIENGPSTLLPSLYSTTPGGSNSRYQDHENDNNLDDDVTSTTRTDGIALLNNVT